MRIWDVSLSPKPAYPGSTDSLIKVLCIRSLIEPPRLRLVAHSVALPHRLLNKGLYLNISRGEPAISGFDRHITPNHKSSHVISPTTRSDLLSPFGDIRPAHG